METVITRDTDILREYLAAIDARASRLSPFAKFAATVKLARLRRELETTRIETTDEDLAALRREIDERLERTFLRRMLARPWGGRAAAFLMLVAGQQIILALVLLAAAIFVALIPAPKAWNPVLSHDQPVFLYAFIFFFFFATPALALALLAGGRFFRSWRKALIAVILLVLLSALGVFLVARGKPNPALQPTSLAEFTKERGLNVASYNQWKEANWLMKDPKFQRDYENYLRNGPGRWIVARFNASDDAEWKDSLIVLNEYLDSGHDPEGFRDWVKYYLDRNRIYSEDRIDREADEITGFANRDFLGIWQVEPYLKERDQRLYAAYLGSINKSMKLWGLAALGLLILIFLMIYSVGPALSLLERRSGRARSSNKINQPEALEPGLAQPDEAPPAGRSSRWRERYDWFPERRDISTPPFFDTSFKLLSQAHRSFVRLALLASLVVFIFWAAVYAIDLASGHENAPSQVALMRSHLLFGGAADAGTVRADDSLAEAGATPTQQDFNYAAMPGALPIEFASNSASREEVLAARVKQLEYVLDEADYQNTKEFDRQNEIIKRQRSELNLLQGLSSELQETTSQIPNQFSDTISRIIKAEAQAGQVANEVSMARKTAEDIKKELTKEIKDVESRVTRAADQAGKIEEKNSQLATRTEALEKEMDRRVRQIEARTEELGDRTASLQEREERINRLQTIVFASILSTTKADVESLDQLGRDEARRKAQALRQRITAIMTGLREMTSEQAKQLIAQLEEFARRADAIIKQSN